MKTSKQIFLITLILFIFVVTGCSRNLMLGDGGGDSGGDSVEVASKPDTSSNFSQQAPVPEGEPVQGKTTGEAGNPRLYEKPGSQSFGSAQQGMPGNGAYGSFSADGMSGGTEFFSETNITESGAPFRLYEKPDARSFGSAQQGMPGNGASGSFSAEGFSGDSASTGSGSIDVAGLGTPSRLYEKPDARSFGSAQQGMPGNGASGSFSANAFSAGPSSDDVFMFDEDAVGPDVPEDEIRRLLAYSSSAVLQDIYFAYDKFDPDNESREILQNNAEYLMAHPNTRIEIQGHCDERGSNNYNIALGQRRAQSVKSILVSLGVNGNQIRTISYGEERPFCFENNEECWRQNRRGHLLIAE